jgi:Pectate lyase superfamily protein/Right handed beta helix region
MFRKLAFLVIALLFIPIAASAAVINVTTYGATGNGTTDDTASIQNALNAVPADGAEVYVPAGNYKITATIKIKSKTRFRGDGMRASRIFWGATADGDLIENADQANGNTGIIIEDLEIDGNRASSYNANVFAGFGIELGNVTDFHVERCYIHDVVRDGIDVTGVAGSGSGYSQKGFITNNLITGNGRPYTEGGITYQDGAGVGIIIATDIVIANNVITGNSSVGVHLEKNNAAEVLEEISISDNIIRNNVAGGVYVVGHSGSGGEAEHISITGNTIENVGEGIRIENARHYLVASNRISVTVRHGIRVHAAISIDGTISGNHIYDVGSGGSERDGININTTQSRISITGNHIQGVMTRMRRAIDAPSATDLLITGNIGRGGTDATQINAPALSNVVTNNKVN